MWTRSAFGPVDYGVTSNSRLPSSQKALSDGSVTLQASMGL